MGSRGRSVSQPVRPQAVGKLGVGDGHAAIGARHFNHVIELLDANAIPRDLFRASPNGVGIEAPLFPEHLHGVVAIQQRHCVVIKTDRDRCSQSCAGGGCDGCGKRVGAYWEEGWLQLCVLHGAIT